MREGLHPAPTTHQNLGGQHEGEYELVALKQAALNVEVDLVGHMLDDVVDALGREGRPLRQVNSQLIQLIKLG